MYSNVCGSFHVTESEPGLTAPVISLLIFWYWSYPGIVLRRSCAAMVAVRTASAASSTKPVRRSECR